MMPDSPSRVGSAGFSLIELLIAMTIGLLLLMGLSFIFVNASESSRELQKTSQQIENGRFAIDTLTQNIHHAGFYGHLFTLPTAAALPDPCEIANLTDLKTALALPIQGYRASSVTTRPDVSATSCVAKGLLTTANLRLGSDVLVVRRASTQALSVGTVPPLNELYIISSGKSVDVQSGTGNAGNPITDNKQVDGVTACAPYCMRNAKTAPIRKYVVHVYFVAPCSAGSGTNGVCTGSDDAIPTLKRLELVSESGTRKMKIVPLVEGVEYLKVEYGIDNLPSAVAKETGLIGDGTVDAYTATPTLAQWTTTIAANVYVLARNTEATNAHIDTKSYTLGSTTIAATNDQFKRHAYSASVRLINPMERREIP